MLRIKNKIIKDANIAQNTTFCGSNSLEKNSPAKYPATIILEKSPTSFAIFSLDLERNSNNMSRETKAFLIGFFGVSFAIGCGLVVY